MAQMLTRFLQRLQAAGGSASRTERIRDLFTRAYVLNIWGSAESRSGPGSTLERTAALREELPKLFAELGVRSVLDIGCGDFNWFRTLDVDVHYTGIDVVDELIQENRRRYGRPDRRFEVMEITAQTPPRADLVFTRDCLVHLENSEIETALANIRKSGATYLLATTFVDRTTNPDIPSGAWRPINLEKPPFSLGPPLRLISESQNVEDDRWTDKAMGLWKL